jgi:hypothetical protein
MSATSPATPVAFVTGGARGIGFAIAKRILLSGGRCSLWDADAGALEGAQLLSLAVAPKVVKERTASCVEAQFAGWSDAPTYQATYEIVDWNGQNAIRVLLSGNRPSFFSSKLPEGGWKFRGEATAAPVGKTPLCVLAIGDGTQPRLPVKQFVGDMIHLKGHSAVESPDCGVHS